VKYRRNTRTVLWSVLAAIAAFLAAGAVGAAPIARAAPAPFSHFTVTPQLQGAAGSTTLVYQSITPCKPPPGTVRPVVVYGFSVRDQTGPGAFGSFVFAPVDPATGNWQGQYAIGAGMPPGAHTLVAACLAGGPSGTVYQAYASDAFTVNRGGAPGVAGAKATRTDAGNYALTGLVDGNGFDVSDWYFQYGPNTSYGARTFGGGGIGNAAQGVFAVADRLIGIAPGKTIHFRLVATNANGTTRGADQQFTEPATPKPPRAADVQLKKFSFNTGRVYGSQLLKNCSADPAFCGASSAGYFEQVTGTIEIWAHQDGAKPTLFFVIRQLTATFFVFGHRADEFSRVGWGNHVVVDDTNPCTGAVTSTNEDSLAKYVPTIFDISRDASVTDSYTINAAFNRPTIRVNGGGIFSDWEVENGTQGINLPVDITVPNSCS
jgi:hypothetical protein